MVLRSQERMSPGKSPGGEERNLVEGVGQRTVDACHLRRRKWGGPRGLSRKGQESVLHAGGRLRKTHTAETQSHRGAVPQHRSAHHST